MDTETQKAAYPTRGEASNPANWRPPTCQARVPNSGVALHDNSVFQESFDRNVSYLLDSFSVDEMLYDFRLRSGMKNPARERDVDELFGFWTDGLRGSAAGRFLMGAGNSLRWDRHNELRRRLEAIVDGIGECQEGDGYIFGFKHEEYTRTEHGNYARTWFTQGMVDAVAVYPKALELMRLGQDWFNQCDWLPNLIYLALGYQAHPDNLAMYHSAAGKPEDVQLAEKHFVLDWWLDKFLAQDPAAIWKYPLSRPHCYEISVFEAYLDHYLASGEQRYLDAMRAAWTMLRENWQHIGGAWALCENHRHPPKSYRRRCTGELCARSSGSVPISVSIVFSPTKRATLRRSRNRSTCRLTAHGRTAMRSTSPSLPGSA